MQVFFAYNKHYRNKSSSCHGCAGHSGGSGGSERGEISIALRGVLMNSDLKITIIFEFYVFKFMGIHPHHIIF